MIYVYIPSDLLMRRISARKTQKHHQEEETIEKVCGAITNVSPFLFASLFATRLLYYTAVLLCTHVIFTRQLLHVERAIELSHAACTSFEEILDLSQQLFILGQTAVPSGETSQVPSSVRRESP